MNKILTFAKAHPKKAVAIVLAAALAGADAAGVPVSDTVRALISVFTLGS